MEEDKILIRQIPIVVQLGDLTNNVKNHSWLWNISITMNMIKHLKLPGKY